MISKKEFTLLVFLFALTTSRAQYAFIPDSNFRNFLMTNGFAACMQGDSLDTTCTAVINATAIDCSNKGISDLTGIQYFDLLWTLNCAANPISALPALSASIRNLNCSYSQLTSLPSLPPALLELQCQFNSFSTLPPLPAGLTSLRCGGPGFQTLPALPPGLTELFCTECDITFVPSLPSSLVLLVCYSNLQLQSLPALSSSLELLNCDMNSINSLPQLPGNLKWLYCGYNDLTSIPALPDSLVHLNCESNLLNSLPPLPAQLRILECSFNSIDSLPSLPSTLTDLECEVNQLDELPLLPPGITTLLCSDNMLTALPPLPDSLERMYCSNNLLTSLPSFPQSVEYLYRLNCDGNQLTSLPPLPDSITWLDIFDNPIACFPQLKTIYSINWYNTNITCIPNTGNITLSQPLIDTVPLCDQFGPCPLQWNISGSVFFDASSNCIQDSSELSLFNIPVVLDSGGTQLQVMFTDNAGRFSFETGLGNYELRIDTTGASYQVVCPVTFIQSSSLTVVDSIDSGIQFGLQCEAGFDLSAESISPNQLFRPGLQTTLQLNAGDAMRFSGVSCANGISGSVQAVLGNLFSYVSPAPGGITPSSVNGDTVTWNIGNFALINPSRFKIIGIVSTSATLNDSICIQLNVSPAVDNDPSNNSLSECFPVFGSFDPNEKYMSPSGIVDTSQQWFTFTVFFQNVGTAAAEDIYILDTLDQNLDATTFTYLSSSHDVITQLLPGNILRFNYPDINLADSTTNEPASHGFVKFKVKRAANLPVGTVISNVADIFFDHNSPVTTNVVSATLHVCPAVTADYTATDSICPGTCISFQNLSLNATYYQWYFPGAVPSSSTDENPANICYEYGGYFPVTLIAGCLNLLDTLSLDTFITVYPAVILGTGNQMLCQGTCTDFNDITDNASSWQWYFDGGVPSVSSVQNPSGICYPNPGSYNVTLVVSASGCSDSVVLANFITVYPLGSVSIQQSDDTLYATNGFMSYQWFMDSILISGATNSFYVATLNGDYSVVAVDQFGCEVEAEILNVMTGLLELSGVNGISVYPNPVQGQLMVDSKQYTISSIEIRDIVGQKVVCIKSDGRKQMMLDLSNFPTGLYFIRVSFADGLSALPSLRKFIKQ